MENRETSKNKFVIKLVASRELLALGENRSQARVQRCLRTKINNPTSGGEHENREKTPGHCGFGSRGKQTPDWIVVVAQQGLLDLGGE